MHTISLNYLSWFSDVRMLLLFYWLTASYGMNYTCFKTKTKKATLCVYATLFFIIGDF